MAEDKHANNASQLQRAKRANNANNVSQFMNTTYSIAPANGANHPITASLVRTETLRRHAHQLIPGGCHTYAKGDDQYPEQAPAFIVRGEGCHVWDTEGEEYIEYGMGLRSVTLGHAYPSVVQAATEAMQHGTNFNRPALIELELAETLTNLIEGAEQVKFTKDGSSATSAAIKLARAYTGREKIARCANHPFFSYDDWFMGSTEINAGIPNTTRQLTLSFQYNHIESLRAVFDQNPDQIACVIMEPARMEEPKDYFLHQVKDVCRQHGAVLIFDEMITGFRWHLQGAQKVYDVVPDLSTFGKGMANGFSVSALVGKRELMDLGGLYHDNERVFLLSSTHGAETHALAAALATINTYQTESVIEYLYRQGERLRAGINQTIAALNLSPYFELLGRPCNMVYATRDQEGNPSQPFRTLFLQEILKRGILAPSLVVSYAHTDEDIDRTIQAVSEALYVYQRALNEGVEKYLVGRPVKPVYRKYN